jgi:hypothetical protein
MLGGDARLPTVTQLVSRAQVSTASWLKNGPPTGLTPWATRKFKCLDEMWMRSMGKRTGKYLMRCG